MSFTSLLLMIIFFVFVDRFPLQLPGYY